MTFKEAFKSAGQAAKANLYPGLFLWALLVVFMVAYFTCSGFRDVLQQLTDFKLSMGYWFSFFSYVLFAALLSELMQVFFDQNGKPTMKNIHNFLFGAILWGCSGVLGDLFYHGQAFLFGENNDWKTLIKKTCVDMYLYTPVINGFITAIFLWKSENFSTATLSRIFSANFLKEHLMPVLIAAWCVWTPGVLVIYSMPTALQLPIASFILCFWVLLFAFVRKKNNVVKVVENV
jgi:hypothetical protein